MPHACSLTFYRESRYIDRAVKYLVEVDDRALTPRLTGSRSLTATVQAGEHAIRVSIGRWKYFEAHILVRGGDAKRFEVIPGPLRNLVARQPRLIERPSGLALPGAVGRRDHPINDRRPTHSSQG